MKKSLIALAVLACAGSAMASAQGPPASVLFGLSASTSNSLRSQASSDMKAELQAGSSVGDIIKSDVNGNTGLISGLHGGGSGGVSLTANQTAPPAQVNTT